MAEAGAGRRIRTDVPMDEGTDFTVTNYTSAVALDCSGASNNDLGDVLGTVIERLIAVGILNGTHAA